MNDQDGELIIKMDYYSIYKCNSLRSFDLMLDIFLLSLKKVFIKKNVYTEWYENNSNLFEVTNK